MLKCIHIAGAIDICHKGDDIKMNDKNTNTKDTTATIEIDKIIETDTTIRMDKVTDKNTKWHGFKKWFSKYITICAKKVGECSTALAKTVAKCASSCVKQISKYNTTCTKQISRTKFSAIMNVKYNEIYGEIRNSLIKITCKLAHQNETKEIAQFKRLDDSDTSIETNTQTIKKICAFFIFIFKRIVAFVKCVAVFILNAVTILGVLVARVFYYIAKEIAYSFKEIVLAFGDAIDNLKRF